MTTLLAPAKVNLALVVGPLRPDGKHEIVTLYERLELADAIHLEPGPGLEVAGFRDDTLVSSALTALAHAARVPPRWHVTIEKHIPVAAGLGGGSSDAAAALRLANATLDEPVGDELLHDLAASVGADVPFFLTEGPQLGEADGTSLRPVSIPRDYHVVLVLPTGEAKRATKDAYGTFDERGGELGFGGRREALLAVVSEIERASDLTRLPRNDLAHSPLAATMEDLGAFRADVTGAGPTVYGLFQEQGAARAAADELAPLGRVWVTAPAWYG